MKIISGNYSLKWQLKTNDKYAWSSCGKLFNLKSGREIKKTLNGGSKGYWIERKFMTLENLRNKIERVKKSGCPF